MLNLYLTDRAPRHARPEETALRVAALDAFFKADMLSTINGRRCREYVEHRGSEAAARRELEDLRAAINHHRREGLCSEIVGVALPAKPVSRDRWLTRSEAARLIWAAWRYREHQNYRATDRYTLKHVARFVLVALYTGTRSAAICRAALGPREGTGWVDLERGVFYRRASGARETKKRQPAIRLPAPLLAHMRRWKANRQRFVVEWLGQPVKSVRHAFTAAVKAAGLEGRVTPHTLRHTAATWQMQSRTDPATAAGYLGMTEATMRTVYQHHHPDYQDEAVTAHRRHRPGIIPERNKGTEADYSETSEAKVVGLSRAK